MSGIAFDGMMVVKKRHSQGLETISGLKELPRSMEVRICRY